MCKCIVIDVEVMGVRYMIDNFDFFDMLRLIYCILFLFSDKKRGCVLK